uniref:Uncharacterized protein n=1 Tax=Podoviridae sp. ctG4L18 TaxID=2825234 RepID=A0A8S5UP08_9CAUD|nr:MAG TPA: hypothetical protein [Podoviridae sp. ctG4L18]
MLRVLIDSIKHLVKIYVCFVRSVQNPLSQSVYSFSVCLKLTHLSCPIHSSNSCRTTY